MKPPSHRQPDLRATAQTKARYDRIAPFYDFFERIPERRYRPWRSKFWDRVRQLLPVGGQLLEVGVGTGKNMTFWPPEAQVTAVDLSPAMLERAKRRATELGLDVHLEPADAQNLPFASEGYDLAAMTFVMCSVPDPMLGLREVSRVVKPGGWVLLMEHVRSKNPLVGRLMDLFNPLVVRMMGPNINRDTVENVELAGLELFAIEDLGLGGIFKIIEAKVP